MPTAVNGAGGTIALLSGSREEPFVLLARRGIEISESIAIEA
jgi:hypothetical protein